MKASGYVIAALALVAVTGAKAQPASTLADGRSGQIEFESITPTGFHPLARRAAAPKASIHGTLTLPSGEAKIPAMVLAHGSGGVSGGREGRWASRLTEWGIAAFVVDSFGPRGIRETATNQGQLSPAANVADALAALRLLATHPRIDPRRIGVMGFSRGGQVAIYTALEPLRRGVIDDDLRFAVHVPFYPPCNTLFVADQVTGAPLLFMLGGADDYTPASACPRYVEWFRSKGTAADSILYEDAHHGFDGTAAVQVLNSVQTARNCDARYDVQRGTLQRNDTGEVLHSTELISRYYRSCSSRGATIGGNHQATQKAAADLSAYLKKIFAM